MSVNVLCCLDGFSDPLLCPTCDQAPCDGDGYIDVGDIIAELDAFGGTYLCGEPCPGGACIMPDMTCADPTNTGPPGLSRTTDCSQGGTYCGDYSLCGDPGCP